MYSGASNASCRKGRAYIYLVHFLVLNTDNLLQQTASNTAAFNDATSLTYILEHLGTPYQVIEVMIFGLHAHTPKSDKWTNPKETIPK